MDEVQDLSSRVPRRLTSTAGYAEAASVLAGQYESVTLEAVLGNVLPYLAMPRCRVADIGAGTGRDASALAARGHEVIAVEPVRELRAIGERLHVEAPFTWVDDALPGLRRLSGEFGLILMVAVWMHLDPQERARGLRRIVRLLAAQGRLVLTLRHGPVLAGRRMFDVAPEEVIDSGAKLGLDLIHRSHSGDLQGRAEATWTNLVFEQWPSAAFAG